MSEQPNRADLVVIDRSRLPSPLNSCEHCRAASYVLHWIDATGHLVCSGCYDAAGKRPLFKLETK